jgi:hypothetical protein
MNIENMKLEELKAIAFDEIRKVEIANNNLKILSQEIQKRESEPKDEIKEKATKK